MQNRKLRSQLLALLFFASAALAQDKMLQPAPELKQLNYFAGAWKTEANVKPSPFGPGGKFTATEHYEWQKGNFFLIGHIDFASPMGNGVELSIMGFDPAKAAFTYNAFSSSGEHEVATGTFAGNTWTWIADVAAPLKWRYVQKILSPDSYSMKFETSKDGVTWSTSMEGTATRQ